MRKFYLFLILCVAGFSTMSARKVSRNEALQKAKSFMPSRQFKESVKKVRSNITINSSQPYYIFNDLEGRGFVIVSGVECDTPVLGYAESGSIDADNIPDNMQSWLEDCSEHMGLIDFFSSEETVSRPEKTAIAPLIQTEWNQNAPYSLMTPTYTNDKGETIHYNTGCVTTAIAQVMQYHQWPKTCQAIPAYTTATQQIFRQSLPSATFKWDMMQSSYAVNYTDESADAVAELMAYVGQAMKMNYDKYSSKAVLDLAALASYFGYSRNAYVAYRDYYSNSLWENLIYDELAAGRPVLYSGQSESGAHQFICDGYDGHGLFHINWGWGGSCNGYFLLSLANPNEKEEGPGFSGYAAGQSAIIGLQPQSVDEAEIPHFNTSVVAFEETSYNRTSVNADFKDVSTEGCYINGTFNYDPSTVYNMELGWALFENGELKKVINSNEVQVDKRSASYCAPKKINFGAGMKDDTYRLVMVYRPEGATKWTTATDQQCLYAKLDGEKLSIRGARNTMSYQVNHIDFTGEMVQNTGVNVIVNITNNTDKMRQDAYLWMRQGNETWKEVCQGIGYYEPGQTGDIRMAFVEGTPGTYQVKLTTDSDGVNVLATSEVTIYELRKIIRNDVQYACNMHTKEAKVIAGNYISTILENVDIPATLTVDGADYTVTRIDDYAFKDAVFLKKIKLPSSLKEIGSHAFSSCKELAYIISDMTEPCVVRKDAFEMINSSKDAFASVTLCVPVGTKSDYESADVWSDFQHIYQGEHQETTQNGITYSYYTSEEFAHITASDRAVLTNTDLVIPSVIEVDGQTYHVRSIGRNAFLNATSLQTITLPEGLLEIGENAFINCYGLKEVRLPSTLQQIGNYAFANCTRLTSVVSAMTEPCAINNVFVNSSWKGDVLVEEHSTAVLYVPKDSKPYYTSDDEWRDFSSIVEVEMETADVQVVPVQTTDYRSTQIYSLSGHRLTQLQKGINVINGRKVLIR